MTITLPIDIIKLEDDSYHLMVDVYINNQKTGHLIVDTGASKTVFDRQFTNPFAKDVKDVEENQSSGINAMIGNAKTGILNSLEFGELIIKDYQCIMLDLSHINDLYEKYANKYIAGLLGSDFLLKYNAIIDYKQKKLLLRCD